MNPGDLNSISSSRPYGRHRIFTHDRGLHRRTRCGERPAPQLKTYCAGSQQRSWSTRGFRRHGKPDTVAISPRIEQFRCWKPLCSIRATPLSGLLAMRVSGQSWTNRWSSETPTDPHDRHKSPGLRIDQSGGGVIVSVHGERGPGPGRSGPAQRSALQRRSRSTRHRNIRGINRS